MAMTLLYVQFLSDVLQCGSSIIGQFYVLNVTNIIYNKRIVDSCLSDILDNRH